MWVGNWRECVVSLGAPDARVLAFIALGERFLLDVPLSVATGGWFTCCRWRPLWISCRSTEEVAVGKLFHNCQCSILCAALQNPTLYKLICVVRWYLECYDDVFKTVGVCFFSYLDVSVRFIIEPMERVCIHWESWLSVYRRKILPDAQTLKMNGQLF